MSSGMFMQVSGISGESSDSKHSKWIEITSWDCKYTQPGTPVKGSDDAKIDRARHDPFKVTKKLDSSSASLKKKCWKGDQIDKVVIECFRATGDTSLAYPYLIIELKDVMISEYSLKASGGGELPEEDLEFAYVEINFTYYPIDKSSENFGSKTFAGHNLETNVVK